MAGRKQKLTKDLINKVYKLIKMGAFDNVVYTNLNISKSSYYDWLKRGEADREAGKTNLYVELLDTVELARSEVEILLTGKMLEQAINGKIPAITYLLERRFGDNWLPKKDEVEQEETTFTIIMPVPNEEIDINDIPN